MSRSAYFMGQKGIVDISVVAGGWRPCCEDEGIQVNEVRVYHVPDLEAHEPHAT
jgi:hypothetical protein